MENSPGCVYRGSCVLPAHIRSGAGLAGVLLACPQERGCMYVCGQAWLGTHGC